jgi:hypothetical protein
MRLHILAIVLLILLRYAVLGAAFIATIVLVGRLADAFGVAI